MPSGENPTSHHTVHTLAVVHPTLSHVWSFVSASLRGFPRSFTTSLENSYLLGLTIGHIFPSDSGIVSWVDLAGPG